MADPNPNPNPNPNPDPDPNPNPNPDPNPNPNPSRYDVLASHSADAFRYFLMRDAPVGSDINFSEEALSMRFNSELADTYGNLVNRGLKLCESYCGGKVPPTHSLT